MFKKSSLIAVFFFGFLNISYADGMGYNDPSVGTVLMPGKPTLFFSEYANEQKSGALYKDEKSEKSSDSTVIENEDSDLEEDYADSEYLNAPLVSPSYPVAVEEKKEPIHTALKGGSIVVGEGEEQEDLSVKKERLPNPYGNKHNYVEVKDNKVDSSFYDNFKDYTKEEDVKNDVKGDEVLTNKNIFSEAFSALRPEQEDDKEEHGRSFAAKKKVKEFRNAYLNSDKVKNEFYNEYITENRYLSPLAPPTVMDEEDVETEEVLDENADEDTKSLDESILQVKIAFEDKSAALDSINLNILRSFSQILQDDPTKGVQVTISKEAMKDVRKKKLAARRLAIVSKVLKEEGVSDDQIIPVLTDRDFDSMAFSVIPVDKYEDFRVSDGKDMFGDEVNSKAYSTMSW